VAYECACVCHYCTVLHYSMNLMTSMLHDNDRNAVYEKAISIIIKDFQDVHGRAPTVLDIGE
jgi:hypothetical protein